MFAVSQPGCKSIFKSFLLQFLYEIGYETDDLLFSPVTGLHVPSGVKYINIVSRLLCVCRWD